MRVAGRDKLDDFMTKHAQSKGKLSAWLKETENVDWKTSQDIKQRYASASFLSNNQVVFNISGNKYRLVVVVRYRNGIVAIDKVGTHAEYDKWKLK